MKVAPISHFTINGNSMHPTLHPGQDVLSFNWAYLGRKPKVGDIVVVKLENNEIIKRVKSVDGDRVEVVGDNSMASTDSKDFGSVDVDQVVGKVVYITPRHSELDSESIFMDSRFRGNDMVDCPQCGYPVIGIYGRKDAICRNCGFKLTCYGEP